MNNIHPTPYVAASLVCSRRSEMHADSSFAHKVLRCGMSPIRRFSGAICLLLVVVLSPVLIAADEPGSIQTTLVAELLDSIETSDGRRVQRFIPATVVSQGQVVFYTVQVRNPTSVPVRDATIVQRIPANTTYVAGSAAGPSADITFSVDGGLSFWPEKALVVAKPPAEARKATPSDYTHIRWQLRNALAPGAVALTRFQAVFQ
jgi:uncharacterized repeat protein (TIGR01451 family)